MLWEMEARLYDKSDGERSQKEFAWLSGLARVDSMYATEIFNSSHYLQPESNKGGDVIYAENPVIKRVRYVPQMISPWGPQ